MDSKYLIDKQIQITADNTGKRLDIYLSELLSNLSDNDIFDDDSVSDDSSVNFSRSYIKKLIDNGNVSVNYKKVKSGYSLKENDIIDLKINSPRVPDILPENINIDIVYEDDDIVIVNKPKGMVVHPAPGHYTGTLVNALMYHCKDSLSGINGEIRPGIVHRIDKDTSGILVICKNDNSHKKIAEQLKVHSITRVYKTIVIGHVSESEGTIEGVIGRSSNDRKKMSLNVKNGKHAVTHYKVIDNLNGKYTMLECRLETGRTHQIRVSMASIGHPVLGDLVYGPKKSPVKLSSEGQVLHAEVLGFIHPTTGKYVEFKAPLPDYFKEAIKKTGGFVFE
ncbi:MAG: RluA family pseudouridine synthase [Lachnospiraceae bacterium]|nr:RluA family pseudouridine synthase [Lachnospiraceae bacterium]